MLNISRSVRAVGALAFVLMAACSDQSAPDRVLGPSASLASSARVAPQLASIGAATELLSCPALGAAEASRVIGPRGGFLAVGGQAVAIPPGAVRHPTRFTLRVPGNGYAEIQVSAEGMQHYVFQRPVVVTLDYSMCGVEPSRAPFTAWYVDGSENMGGIDDRLNQRLFFATNHLSGYAVAYLRDEEGR